MPDLHRLLPRLLSGRPAACIAPCLAILLGAALLPAAAAPRATAYTLKTSTEVKGLEMRIWKKPQDSGGASRVAWVNGRAWFAEKATGRLVGFGADGVANLYTIPVSGINVRAVAAGTGGDVWFAAFNKGVVGRLRSTGQFSIYQTGKPTLKSFGMARAQDGSMWFATARRGLGRTTTAGSTTFTKIADNKDRPTALALGGDGNIWYVESQGKHVGRVTPAGKVKEFKAFSSASSSYGVAAGPDGRIWFTDPERKRIGRMKTNGGGLTYFKNGLSGTPISIVAGPDNKLYFGQKEGRIGRITTGGKIKEFPIPGAAGTKKFPVLGLTAGADGNIWFVNDKYSEVGRLRLVAANVDCVKNVWENLEACGWPGPTNTGYPASKQLTVTPSRRITANNTVIDGEKITGGLVIAAKNVTVKNSWIIEDAGGGSGNGVIKIEPGASATITRTRLDGSGRTHAGIWYEGDNLVARGNHITGVNDGIFVWDTDNFVLEDNYLHDFTEDAGNGHVDGFQTEGASHGVIRHNVFDVTQGQTSALAIWNGRRDSDDYLIENNLFAGGGFAIYAQDYHPSEQNPSGGYSVTNIRFRNNKFSTVHYPCVGQWGVWFSRGAPTDGWDRSGNVVLETGYNVDTRNPPHPGGWTCD